LLGATAPGIERSQYSPLGEVVPEVFFFSLAIEQVLSGESLLRLHTLKGIEIVILLLISVGLIVVFSRYPSYIILRIFVGLQVGLYGLSTLLFARYDLVFYPVFISISLLMLLVILLFQQSGKRLK